MIKIEELKKTYDRRSRNANKVLHGMSFTLPDKGFVCILGASGCGKTTLLNAIGGLDTFDSGKIITDSAEIKRSGSRAMENERNANFGYIFQNYYLLPEHSAAYNIYLGMHSMPLSKKEKMKRVRDALEKVDMLRYRKRNVGQLSGGQQQRIAIARAIAKSPRVIFADEPTGNLDEANTTAICTVLKNLSKESLVVMVTHEERIAKFFADRIITLEDGRIINDTTDWSRGTMDAGEKDAVYSLEYDEELLDSEKLSLRVLAKNDAEPVKLTIITEKDRIIIKTDDARVVLSSEVNAAPRLIEGKRPVLNAESFDFNAENEEGEEGKKEKLHTATTTPRSRGLGFKFMLREARALAKSKRLGKIGVGIFIILLSLMMSISASDIISLASINPEEFIFSDSHVLDIEFNRGDDLGDDVVDITGFISEYREHLNSSGLDFDYVIKTGKVFLYTDSTVPQIGTLSLRFDAADYVNISRLDESTLIHGRMPQRFDEIVIDRWLIDRYLAEDGIIQNIIPNREYFIGKKISYLRSTDFSPTIVGICDSGEPSMYLTREALLAHGNGGIEAMSFSEFKRLTGYDKLDGLLPNECIVLADNAGEMYTGLIGSEHYFGNGRYFIIKDAPLGTDDSISVKYILSDEYLDSLFDEMIENQRDISIWCADKEEMLEYINLGMPESLKGMLKISISDRYRESYEEYREASAAKVDARTIITATVFVISAIMLYLMQRSKINEHMGIIAVYRLLGIPKRKLLFIFAMESVTSTLKFAVPTVLLTYLTVNLLSKIETLGFSMLFPFPAAIATLLLILIIRILFSVLPVLRLLAKPPARLAAKYDF